jgi:formylglycine-generating enzyme required for sulfatase activity
MNKEIITIKTMIDFHEQILVKLHQKLKELELSFEIAPVLLEKTCNWYDAVEYCALLGDGWRLPTLAELKMIYNVDNDLNGNCNYWSSTEDQSNTVWTQFLLNGHHNISFKDFNLHVRPVRDIVKSKFPFEIADKSTDIQTHWYAAINHCKALGDGWRLPTSDELDLIYKTDNDFNKGYYWSSTERPTSCMIVLTVSMKTGRRDFENKWQNNIRVRAVRDIK